MLKQYMLVVADDMCEVRHMVAAVHSELARSGVDHLYNRQNTIMETSDKYVKFTYYDSTFDSRIRGYRFTQVVMTQFSDEYDQKIAKSLIRGEGEQMFQVGYSTMREVVNLVNKFLGVSDE